MSRSQPKAAGMVALAGSPGPAGPPMRLEQVGELTSTESVWCLAYSGCCHIQLFAREGLEDPALARREAQRHYATCLSCSLAARLRTRDHHAR